MKNTKFILCLSCVVLSMASCRKDDSFIPEDQEQLPAEPSVELAGFYLLNEANMGSNKSSLDYYDFNSGNYRKNIYSQANPNATLGLGDVGNDIKIYGSRLYVVVNMSDKVEVLAAKTAKRIGQINIPNCRYITFYKSKAYITAYDGYVSVVDTASLKEEKQIAVGKQPEEMAIVGTKLYVANSGGYNYPNYERTVSVIDLNTLSETKRIDVAINLHRLKADQYGDLYVTSRGDYYNIPSNLFVIDTKTDQVKKTFNLAASNIAIDKDEAYLYSVEWNNNTGSNAISYAKINVKDETIISKSFITDGTDQSIVIPYGIAVNPVNSDVYVTDAKDYVSPGTLYCFDKAGKKKFSVTTGDIPAHLVFLNK
ncbi:YncE family protein [Pedobacter rhizosphaerae]|uniref:40-residue YVTN family beta-propeller repeat-containing protein n=1 Tax=Pedobacter rhizosphaerae TaxID=390241 RepID=A0A1H9MA66_9SPHI|nr:YncE family protein [Pedobacter rhizosphaerae]SER20578.1 40-residue YVTN family beta-propeller repeat-containing protein [Pedobacter rhizosphaerae]